jgi:hypothetical protein
MRKLLYLLLYLFFFQAVMAQPEGVSFELHFTGNPTGEVLLLQVENNSDKLFYEKLNPFVFFQQDQQQALLIPFGMVLNVKAHESKDFYLHGFSVFPDRVNDFSDVEKNLDIEIIRKAIEEKQISYESFFADTTQYRIRKGRLSELMPFDYILTTPGGFQMLAYTFDVEQNQALAKVLLIEQAQRLVKAYDRLFTAGMVITHFNADPVFEKELLLQLSVWICGSGIEGKAFKNKHIKKIITEIFTSYKQEVDKKEISEHIDVYFKCLARIGKESNVFLVPMDFDKRPQCLPAVVGMVPTSDNVKAPTLMTNRENASVVRNQVMHKRNDCLPCLLDAAYHSSLKSYIFSLEMDNLVNELEDMRIKMQSKLDSSSDAKNQFNDAFVSLNALQNYSVISWLQNYMIPPQERIELALKEHKQIMQTIMTENNENNLVNVSAFLQLLIPKHRYLLNYILDNYQFRDVKYSFDCCDLTRKPDAIELELADELAAIVLLGMNRCKTILAAIESDWQKNTSYYPDLLNKLLLSATELYSLKVLTNSFRVLANDQQIICLEGPPPSSRLEALERVNNLLGTSLSMTGEYMDDKLYLRFGEKSMLEFHFGDCQCGKKKEILIPFLPKSNNSLQKLNEIESIPASLIPRFELGAFYGQLFFADFGADKFDGNGLAAYDSIDPTLDSTLKSRYSKLYTLNAPEAFHFNRFNQIGFLLGYDLTENLQCRLGAAFSSGSAEGILPLTYYEKPSDTTTFVQIDGQIFSKIQAWSLEGGLRYFYGGSLKVFGGLSASYRFYKNTQTRTYFESLEVRNPVVQRQSVLSEFLELGLRYYPNQDMFVEAAGLGYHRWDKNINGLGRSAIDLSFRVGVGARF